MCRAVFLSKSQQDRQCTYNVTWRRFRATIVALEKQWLIHDLCVCVCVCVFVALSIQHAMRMRRHLWPSPLYNIFPHYLIKGTIFEKKKFLAINVCFELLYDFCMKYFIF